MSLSSDLARYFDQLESAHGQSHLYRPDVLETLVPTTDFQSFNAALQKLESEKRLLVLLRSLAVQKTALSPRLTDAELVVTFPGSGSISARHTLNIVRQMITSAKNEILVAGFAITEAGGVLGQLAEASKRGVRVILICSDWQSKNGQTAARTTHKLWPKGVPQPTIHEYKNDTAETAGMHIKSLLVDGCNMLIGSANFTFPGLNTNFEMGVRIKGQVAEAARAVFAEFIATGRFNEIKFP